jgi:hypothetical protein
LSSHSISVGTGRTAVMPARTGLVLMGDAHPRRLLQRGDETHFAPKESGSSHNYGVKLDGPNLGYNSATTTVEFFEDAPRSTGSSNPDIHAGVSRLAFRIAHSPSGSEPVLRLLQDPDALLRHQIRWKRSRRGHG